MKSRYISNKEMNIYLQKGRRERSEALVSMFSILFRIVKKYLSKNKDRPPKAAMCEQN